MQSGVISYSPAPLGRRAYDPGLPGLTRGRRRSLSPKTRPGSESGWVLASRGPNMAFSQMAAVFSPKSDLRKWVVR